ncbi:hypothetical protein EfmAA290_05260 [Enterococcus faecium]|nr:hypothetical protein EfmAA290_05260 [Enterococcus faecium]
MGLSKLDNLYRQVILDHSSHPHHRGSLTDSTSKIELNNPTCGDVIELQVDVKDGIIKNIADNYREVTRDEFVEILNSSQSFIPSKTKNKGNKSDFLQLVQGKEVKDPDPVSDEKGKVVDLSKDDSRYLSIEKALSINLVHNSAFAIQKSIRYSENLEKFKIVFLLKEAITDYSKMIAVYEYLKKIIPGCDDNVNASNRMFFGGYKSDAVIIINEDNMLDITELPIDFTMTCSKNCQSDSGREYELVNETDFVKLIKNDDKEEMKQWFKDCLFDSSDMSFNEIYERLLTIDMNKLLKSSKNLRCLFHDDHNPSASIFTSKTGHSIFYCHSSNCGISENFIGVVMLILEKDSRVETFNWLLENLDLYPTHFRKLKEESKVLFDTLESMEDKLFRTINNYLEEMRRVYDALLSDVNFFDDSKESVTCILSGEQLAKKMSSYYGKMDRRKPRCKNNDEIPKCLLRWKRCTRHHALHRLCRSKPNPRYGCKNDPQCTKYI